MQFTIFGATGFVGSHLADYFRSLDQQVYCPARDEKPPTGKNLGHIIYCIGLTSDFRKKPFETVEAHVTKLSGILQNYEFDSFVYLSSTRIYIHNKDTVSEESQLIVDVADPFDLFNATKLAGELLTLNCGKLNTKVARISNVYGNDFKSENFITSIVNDALKTKTIVLRTTPNSAKDYISINDVVQLLHKISVNGKHKIYNVASGNRISNKEILEVIFNQTGCVIEYSNTAEQIIFPQINIHRIENELHFKPTTFLLKDLVKIIQSAKEHIQS